MANTNPSNPNRVIRVKDLARFRDKCDNRYTTAVYASEATCESIIDELI